MSHLEKTHLSIHSLLEHTLTRVNYCHDKKLPTICHFFDDPFDRTQTCSPEFANRRLLSYSPAFLSRVVRVSGLFKSKQALSVSLLGAQPLSYMASSRRKYPSNLPEPYQLRQWHDSDPFMTFFPDEEGLTAKELADTFISQTLDFQTSLDEFTRKFALGFARTLARADESMRQCQMANEEYPSEQIVFTVLLKKGDALWGELRPWLNERRELLYLIDDMKLDSAPVVPIAVSWARELTKDRKTKEFCDIFRDWIREVEEAFNDPNALKGVYRIAPDSKVERDQAMNVRATTAQKTAKNNMPSTQSRAKVMAAKIQSKDRTVQTKRWAKAVVIQDSDSEATTVFDDESETHSDVTSKGVSVSNTTDCARGRYSQILENRTHGDFQFVGAKAIRTRNNGVARQPRVPRIRPGSKSRAEAVAEWVEDVTAVQALGS